MTSRLYVRVIQLDLNTPKGHAGTTTRLERGFNVLRADNSSGKSTCLQAIIYGLGLEGMLSAQRSIPLPHSMTDRVSLHGEEVAVLNSCVRLELENGAGRIITIERQVKHPTISNLLVQVWEGPLLTDPGEYAQTDYFVRRRNAAIHEAGFHHFLAEYLGWELPQVTRIDGSEGPLYLECLFPYFYVEQKHGWSGVQARMPTYLGIREVGKRSAEFLLGLEALDRILERQRLTSAASIMESEWQQALDTLTAAVAAAGLVLSKGPQHIVRELPNEAFVAQMHDGARWLDVDAALDQLESEIAELQRRPPQVVGQRATELEVELSKSQAELDRNVAGLVALTEEQRELAERRDQLALRVEALEEDLERHKDALVLQDLGSSQSVSLIADHVCPTCHQQLDDGADITSHAMTAAQNIQFVTQQLDTFRAMHADAERVLAAMRARASALRQGVASQRTQVRAIKDALVGQSNAPSIADVTRVVTTQARRDAIRDNRATLASLRTRLADLTSSYAANRERMQSLQTDQLTPADSAKLDALEAALRVRLAKYQFDSLPPADVDISRETYRPAHEGFDLGFDISASDMIRVIWAYLMSLLSVSGDRGGHHLGLLVFDEPRQQETARESYEQLLQQAAHEARQDRQILFATSETSTEIRRMLGTASHNLIDVAAGSRIIQPRFGADQ
jgi:hypothetical protein